MTTTTHDEAIDALEPFAELPDWLAGLMRPGRLEESLRRHVPELADGRLSLVECRADRLRAKDENWLARCRVIVTGADHPPAGLPHHALTVRCRDPLRPALQRERSLTVHTRDHEVSAHHAFSYIV